MKLKILYRDRSLIAVHKPAGSVIYADGSALGVPVMQNLLREEIAAPVYPVHRLDKGTCGVLLFALSGEMAAEFQKFFATKSVRKTYLALVGGETERTGVINEPLTGNKDKIKKPARTQYKTIKQGKTHGYQVSLLEVYPETGRYHQIRRHLRHIGHSIVGDDQYGGLDVGERALLSAIMIEFIHPISGKKIRIQTQPDPDFLMISRAL